MTEQNTASSAPDAATGTPNQGSVTTEPENEEAAEAAEEAELAAIFEEVTAPGFGRNPAALPDEDRAGGTRAPEQTGQAAAPQKTEDDAGAATAPSGAQAAPDDAAQAGAADSASEIQADIWSGASPEQIAAYKAAEKELGQLRQYRSSQEGRIAAFQRRIKTLEDDPRLAGQQQSNNVSRETRGNAADPSSQIEALFGDEEWKGLKEEYSELVEPFEKKLRAVLGQVQKQGASLDAINTERTEMDYADNAQALEEAHEGWGDFINQHYDAFFGWVQEQPSIIKRAAVENQDHITDPESAALVLTLFKDSLGQNGAGQGEAANQTGRASGQNGNQQPGNATDGKRKRQIESSSGVRPQGLGTGTGIAEEGDDEALFNQMEAAGMFNR